jgi:hypothetical protein
LQGGESLSILPEFDVEAEEIITENMESEELPVPKEYAWDFENNNFILKDGKFIIVEGTEAIKIWVWKSLNAKRFKYLAYSWDYGHELEDLIGQGLSREALSSEVERYLNECLEINPYISDVTDIAFDIDGSKVSISFKVITIYGEVDISV